ncbi:MAG: ribonuclease HII [Oscillospiraceae bacterium]
MVYDGLYDFDDAIRAELGGAAFCGVDEAGRGPLAGPVCCAAVILRDKSRFEWLNDSKKTSALRREKLYDEIIADCIAFEIAFVDNETIDRLNILQATLLGMSDAIAKLRPAPRLALIDGNKTPQSEIECRFVIKGDAKSASIAAASVLAKVARDRFMTKLSLKYPMFGFEKHKGYPTKDHYRAIKEYGITPYHRKSFLRGIYNE